MTVASAQQLRAFVWGVTVCTLVHTAIGLFSIGRQAASPNVPNLILEQRTSPRECIAAPGGTRVVRFYGDW